MVDYNGDHTHIRTEISSVHSAMIRHWCPFPVILTSNNLKSTIPYQVMQCYLTYYPYTNSMVEPESFKV